MATPVQVKSNSPDAKAVIIRELAKEGMSARQIAAHLGLSPNHVRSSLSRDRKEGRMPLIRHLKPEAGETLEVRGTDATGLLIAVDALERLGVEPGDPVVVVQLTGEIRIMSREVAAERLRRP